LRASVTLSVEKLGRALLKHGPEHEFTARYLMCSSDPESMSITDLLAFEPGFMEGLGSLHLGYTEYPGAPELRRELATLYESIDIDNLIVHTGAQDAIFSFVHSMLKTGDHMIVHMPGYQSHYAIAEASRVSVSPWLARESENWALDPDELEKLERFCAEVLERTGVLLLPGTLLDDGNEHFRIGLGRRNLPTFSKYLRTICANAVRSRTTGEEPTGPSLSADPLPAPVPTRIGASPLHIHSYTKVLYR